MLPLTCALPPLPCHPIPQAKARQAADSRSGSQAAHNRRARKDRRLWHHRAGALLGCLPKRHACCCCSKVPAALLAPGVRPSPSPALRCTLPALLCTPVAFKCPLCPLPANRLLVLHTPAAGPQHAGHLEAQPQERAVLRQPEGCGALLRCVEWHAVCWRKRMSHCWHECNGCDGEVALAAVHGFRPRVRRAAQLCLLPNA